MFLDFCLQFNQIENILLWKIQIKTNFFEFVLFWKKIISYKTNDVKCYTTDL